MIKKYYSLIFINTQHYHINNIGYNFIEIMNYKKSFNILFIFCLSILLFVLLLPSSFINNVPEVNFQEKNTINEDIPQLPQYYGEINKDNYIDEGIVEIYNDFESGSVLVATMMLVEEENISSDNLCIQIIQNGNPDYTQYYFSEIQDDFNYEYIPSKGISYNTGNTMLLTQDHTENSKYDRLLFSGVNYLDESGQPVNGAAFVLNLTIEDGIINTFNIHQAITEYGSKFTFDNDMSKFITSLDPISWKTTVFFEFNNTEKPPLPWDDDFLGIEMSFTTNFRGEGTNYNTWDNTLNTRNKISWNDGYFKIYGKNILVEGQEKTIESIVDKINAFFPEDENGGLMLLTTINYDTVSTNSEGIWNLKLPLNEDYFVKEKYGEEVFPDELSKDISSILLQEEYEYSSVSLINCEYINKIIQINNESMLSQYTFVGVIVYWAVLIIIILISILFIVLYYFRRKKYV